MDLRGSILLSTVVRVSPRNFERW